MSTTELPIAGGSDDYMVTERLLAVAGAAASPEVSAVAEQVLGLAPRPRPVQWTFVAKRAFDIAASVVGLIVLAPLFLVIAAAIKVSDPGPVFYRHRRLTRVGRPIYIYKFRTMRARYSSGEGFSGKTDAEIFAELGRPDLAEEFLHAHKLREDPRVTRIGHFLRRNSLDELPQLWNIVKGELSTVGPRPIVDAELARYGTGGTTLLSLKPGLTGLWQISGRSELPYEERVKLDLHYVEHWSLTLDMKIIFRTLWAVLHRRGAY